MEAPDLWEVYDSETGDVVHVVASAVAAGVLVALDDTSQRDTRELLVERLIQVALLGAGTIIALLGRFQDL